MLGKLFHPDVPFDSLYISSIYKEIYSEKVYADIFNQNYDTVIDIGANIGDMAVSFIKKSGFKSIFV